MNLVYLNGDYLPLEEARISVLDRGFTFGDGVYEVIPVFGDGILCPEEHLRRLENSLAAVAIPSPLRHDEWRRIFTRLLRERTARGDCSLYIQVTRGVSEREHLYPEGLSPTVFVMCRPLATRDYSQGVAAITHEDIRWKYCHIKAITLLAGVMLKKLAAATDGCKDAILIRDGYLTEGASSNVFIVKGDRIKTPGTDGRVLAGITRDLLVRLLRETGIGCEETAITEAELRSADEVWLSSSTLGVVPVIKLDGQPVGDGKPGAIWSRAHRLYEDRKLGFTTAVQQS
ncbi:MAG: D-amino acid aminotransferase [Gammaproteobacteria bacterium]|nr:MAG: D-amino acid aminotransferase [Gammaproteobacteria bacterium]